MPNANYTSDEGDLSFHGQRKLPPLASFTPKDFAACRKITAETLCSLLDSNGNDFCNKYLLIDCRYPYEYNGGHIRTAINFHDYTKVEELFYPEDKKKFEEIVKIVPIFYCEYSQVRGPKMALSLRQLDREKNEENYPLLDYAEMYLLEGGYNNFYKNFKKQGYCEPDFYTPMNARQHTHNLKQFTFHRTKSQNIMKPPTAETRAAQRRFKRSVRLQSTQSCVAFGTPKASSTPAAGGGGSKVMPFFKRENLIKEESIIHEEKSNLVNEELQKWRDTQRIKSVASEWDSTLDGSFDDILQSCISPIKKVEPHGDDSNLEVEEPETENPEAETSSSCALNKSSPALNKSYIKPIQLSFGSE